jgi:hypothetical protein
LADFNREKAFLRSLFSRDIIHASARTLDSNSEPNDA